MRGFAPALSGFLEQLAAIVGEEHVLTGADLAPWALDERGLYRGQAQAVVRPAHVGEVAAIVAVCRDARVPIIPVGGHTGLVGGAAAPAGALILALSRLNRILDIDVVNNTVTVEAGAILKMVRGAARDADRLFPLSLPSEGSAQIGGLLATNAGGINVFRYGNMRDLTLGVEAVMPDGRVLSQMKGLRKDNTGYDLRHLLIGSEGTLGIITAAVLRLYPQPRQRASALVACPSVADALSFCTLVQEKAGDALTAFEYMSGPSYFMLAEYGVTLPLNTDAPAIVLFDLVTTNPEDLIGERMERVLAQGFERGLVIDGVIGASEAQNAALWNLREHMPEVQKLAGATIKHDISLPLSRLVEFLDAAAEGAETILPGARIVPFGHLGDGNLHYNLAPPMGMDQPTFKSFMPAVNRTIHDLVDRFGGSFSAEHGVGRMKLQDMRRYEDPVALDVMRAIKAALDPTGLFNPGKVLPA